MSGDTHRPDRRFGRRDVSRDVDDEIAFHLEMAADECRERGLDDRSAGEEARRRFGDAGRIRQDCREIGLRWEREKRRASMWIDLWQDARYTLRQFRRAPGFAAVAVLTLALAIGATTAIFSVVHAVLLRPLPYGDSDRLALLWSESAGQTRETLTPGRFLDFRDRATRLDGLAAIAQLSLNLSGDGLPERLNGSSVSTDFFDLLGVRPALGRTFEAADSGAFLAVLSDGLWRRRFGSDPAVVGRAIVLNGKPYRVIGVMPASFAWPEVMTQSVGAVGPDIWIPPAVREVPGFAFDDPNLASNRKFGYLRAVAKLRPGISLDQARTELSRIAAALGREHPQEDGGRGAALVPLRVQLLGDARRPLAILSGAVALVLVIACANLASLLLARASGRRRELALRSAIGASRGRLIRGLLAEALVLSVLAAAIGAVLAAWGTRWLVSVSPASVFRMDEARLDTSALAFGFGVALVTAVACALVPALRASRIDVDVALRSGGRGVAGAGGRSAREVLVVAEVALSVLLLVGAGLLVRSFAQLQRVDVGFQTSHLLAFDVLLTGSRAEYQKQQVEFYNEMFRRIRSLPGVRAVAGTVTLPIGGDDFNATFFVEGRPDPQPGHEPRSGFQIVSPGYFAAMGIPLLAGRDFAETDTRQTPGVVVVSRTLADLQWPGQDPIGRRIRHSPTSPWLTVIGVVGAVRHEGPAAPARAEFYESCGQSSLPFLTTVVRTSGDPLRLVPEIRQAMADLDPRLPLANVDSMEGRLRHSVTAPRFMSTLVGLFGSVALFLSAIGLYAVMAFLVAQRARDIAVRIALGAARSDIVSLVVGRGLLLAGAGVVLGLGGAFATTRLLNTLLFGVGPTDPATFVVVPVLLAAVALAATLAPLRRALRIDPIVALRAE